MSDANERIATLKEALVVAAKDAAACQANALEMERERNEYRQQRDLLATAVDAAIECGIVPKVGTPTAGAAYYERQNEVADMLRDALAKVKGGKP